MSNTYNRGKLKKEIIKGEWLVKCDGEYTDDYMTDYQRNYGKTDYIPAKYFPDFRLWLEESKLEEDFSKAQDDPQYDELNLGRKFSKRYDEEKEANGDGIFFDQNDFRGYGNAWTDPEGTVSLSFGYKSYTFKRKEG